MDENNKFPPVELADDSSVPAKVGKKKVTFAQSETQPSELYRVVYKHNKSFELHANREVIRFENGKVVFPQKYLEGFPKELIESEEFKLQSDNFVVIKIGE